MCYMAGRKQVAVRELRQNLSVHLRRVKKGEILEVTERGQPVAVLAPLPEEMSPVARLRLEGRIARVATKRLEDVRPLRVSGLGAALRRALDEQRADRI
jgi:prevent-host-death family protein